MAFKNITDRSLLRFADEVKLRFVFLETLGFRCVRSEAILVRFEASNIAISVYHDQQSYEISLAIEDVRGLSCTQQGHCQKSISFTSY
jgi:hypothetical protein